MRWQVAKWPTGMSACYCCLIRDVAISRRDGDDGGFDAFDNGVRRRRSLLLLPFFWKRKQLDRSAGIASCICGPLYASYSHRVNRYAPLLACGPFEGILSLKG
jgi:hypothetical protein